MYSYNCGLGRNSGRASILSYSASNIGGTALWTDEDGDIEVLSFSLRKACGESLQEAAAEDGQKLTVANIKKDKTYANLPNKVVNKLIDFAEDEFDAKTVEDFLE